MQDLPLVAPFFQLIVLQFSVRGIVVVLAVVVWLQSQHENANFHTPFHSLVNCGLSLYRVRWQLQIFKELKLKKTSVRCLLHVYYLHSFSSLVSCSQWHETFATSQRFAVFL